jgi:hypothetical protein
MVAGWAQAFTALLDQGTITGFALITVSCTATVLARICINSRSSNSSSAAAALLALQLDRCQQCYCNSWHDTVLCYCHQHNVMLNCLQASGACQPVTGPFVEECAHVGLVAATHALPTWQGLEVLAVMTQCSDLVIKRLESVHLKFEACSL